MCELTVDERIDKIIEYFSPNDDYNRVKTKIKEHEECEIVIWLLEMYMGHDGQMLNVITKSELNYLTKRLEEIDSPLIPYLREDI